MPEILRKYIFYDCIKSLISHKEVARAPVVKTAGSAPAQANVMRKIKIRFVVILGLFNKLY